MMRRAMILLTTAVGALVGIVAVQAFGAKPAEAIDSPVVFFRAFDEYYGVTRFADNLEDPTRLEADDAAKLTKDEGLGKAEKVAVRWTDGHGESVGAAEAALKSKIEEDNIEYVKKRGCEIVDVAKDAAEEAAEEAADAAASAASAEEAAEMEVVPPTDEQVRDMVEADVPAKYLVLKSKKGSSGIATKYLWVRSEDGVYVVYLVRKQVKSELVETYHLKINHLVRWDEGAYGIFRVVPRKQVKSELVEINHLVRQNMKASLKASYSNDEPEDVASEVAFSVASYAASETLSKVIDKVCE